jgi:hypothetical protein
MIIPGRPSWQRRRPVDPVSEPQPSPALRPAQCAYCNDGPPCILCGPEHTAYAGEWLCLDCYARLFEGPILCPQ